MKEYLNKLTDGTYRLVVLSDVIDGHDGLIEIPKGAESFNYFGSEGNVFFLKNDGEKILYSNETGDWSWQDWGDIDFDGVVCLWQRAQQPEELPFMDDKCYTNKSNGGFKLPKEKPCDISKWSELRGESLNDQYAEIEQVRKEYKLKNDMSVDDYIDTLRCANAKPNQTTINAMNEADALISDTLNERESTYGSFTGVANTTGQLMGVLLNSKNGQTLPYVHQEALHMIASKMARIVNGDHNHKDSWHDIAGYATLVERSL